MIYIVCDSSMIYHTCFISNVSAIYSINLIDHICNIYNICCTCKIYKICPINDTIIIYSNNIIFDIFVINNISIF